MRLGQAMEAPGHNLDDLPGSGLPLRVTAIVVYVTLALLALAIPQAAVNRLNDFSPGPLRDNALVVAQAVADTSHRVGLEWPYHAGRRLFLALTGKQED
jgi:hypothetical protein